MSLKDFQAFIENGKYIELLESTKQLEILRNHIREYQSISGKKRMEWQDQGVVGIFEENRVYDNDIEGLKSFLHNLGILPFVSKVDWTLLSDEEKEQMKPWVLKQPHRICFAPKKEWKLEVSRLKNYEEWSRSIKLIEQVEEWKRKKMRNDIIKGEWEREKERLLFLSSTKDLLQCDYGRISCCQNKPMLRGVDLYRICGQEVLFNCNSIDMSELEIYMAKGFLKKSELSAYRRIIDISLRYTLMELHMEKRRSEYYQGRQSYLSNLSINSD